MSARRRRTADQILAPYQAASRLPAHPRTGLTAVAMLPGGRPLWPIAGADDTVTPPVGAPAVPPAVETPPAPAEPVEDKTDWKSHSRKWEDRAKANQGAADELAKLKADAASDLEKQTARADAAETIATAARARVVRAEVRALADGFVDREDAVLRLGDLAAYVDDEGDVDTKKLTAALTKVLADHPHLAKPVAPAPEEKRPPGKPVAQLKPGGAPNAPAERRVSLEDAIAARLNPTT